MKHIRTIFVIMPFTQSPTRDAAQMTAFFENNIRRPIESADLTHEYKVRRSADTFDITEQIIKDLFAADIVICDLSGLHANPNVMYELGIRLASTHEPVILIRENHPGNQQIFDISGFYTHNYDPYNYSDLTAFIIGKLRRLELGEDTYRSPVLIGPDKTYPSESPHRIATRKQMMAAAIWFQAC